MITKLSCSFLRFAAAMLSAAVFSFTVWSPASGQQREKLACNVIDVLDARQDGVFEKAFS